MYIDGRQVAQTAPAGLEKSGKADVEVGRYRNEQAVVVQGPSVLGSSAEEISMQFSSRAEKKKADRLEVRAEPRALRMTPEEIQAFLTGTKAFNDPAALVALARRMLAGNMSPLQLARQASTDVSQQYLLLQFALQQAELDGAPEARRSAIMDALADLDAEAGGAIRAGLAAIDAASRWAETPGEVRTLTQTYRDVALGAASLAETLKLALARFGSQDFASGLKFLLSALGNDLASLRPSNDPVRLRTLVQDIYQLEVFNTLLNRANVMADALGRRYSGVSVDGITFMQQLVSMTSDKWISAARFMSLCEHYRLGLQAARINLLTEAWRMLSEMPVKIYSDEETRNAVLAAGRDAMDEAIADEEAEGEDGQEDDSPDDGQSGEGEHNRHGSVESDSALQENQEHADRRSTGSSE